MVWNGRESVQACRDVIFQVVIEGSAYGLSAPIAYVADFLDASGELEDALIDQVGRGVEVEVAVVVLDAVVDEDAIEDSPSRIGDRVEGIGEAHEGHAMVADADVGVAFGAIPQVDVHHISIFVEYREDELVISGSALMDVKARGESASQRLLNVSDVH